MKIAIDFLLYIIYLNTYFIIYSKIYSSSKEKINLKKHIIITLITAIGFLLLIQNNLIVLKSFLTPVVILVGIKYLYNKLDIKTIGITFIMVLATAFAELIFVLIAVCLMKLDNSIFIDNIGAKLIANICIYFLTVGLLLLKKIKIYISSINDFYKSRNKEIMFFVLGSIIILIIGYINYVYIKSTINYIILDVFFIAVYIYIIEYYKEKQMNVKLSKNYEILFEYTKSFEQLVEQKNKQYHEYNNQLVLIKEMSNVKTKTYIDNLLNEFFETKDNDFYNNLKNICLSDLKGFIYYKLFKMKENKVVISVFISNEVNNKKYWNFNELEKLNISKILGIILDNAYEASILTKSKNIMFQSYIENKKLVFEISNTFDCKELNQSIESKKSTKGKNRGYGLKIVEDITNNSNITVETEVINNYYIKKIKI